MHLGINIKEKEDEKPEEQEKEKDVRMLKDVIIQEDKI